MSAVRATVMRTLMSSFCLARGQKQTGSEASSFQAKRRAKKEKASLEVGAITK